MTEPALGPVSPLPGADQSGLPPRDPPLYAAAPGKKQGKAPELWDLASDAAVESILDELNYACLNEGTVPMKQKFWGGVPPGDEGAADGGGHLPPSAAAEPAAL